MKGVTNLIFEICQNINKNIANTDESSRGFTSQNILSQCRNLVEHIFFKLHFKDDNKEINWENIKFAKNNVQLNGQLKFLNNFYKLLEQSSSHYTFDEENSERLLLKYYEYLLKIKKLLNDEFFLNVLEDLESFPLNTDKSKIEFEKAIAKEIDHPTARRADFAYNDRYYIQKTTPFFVENEIYYEVTFTKAFSSISKFDRIIAFTKQDITPNYAVKLNITQHQITVNENSMPIHIINDWQVSIRPCEISNFKKIFGYETKQKTDQEYRAIMNFLTSTSFQILDFIDVEDNIFLNIKSRILGGNVNSEFFDTLEKCRFINNHNLPGKNVLRYLLHNLNNRIIRAQTSAEPNRHLSNLFLKYGCIPFDQMPFSTSLISHNPKISSVFSSINSEGREHELLARYLKDNTENHGLLYTSQTDLVSKFNQLNIDELIQKYNSLLYEKHKPREIKKFRNQYYITNYVDSTSTIIDKLLSLSKTGVNNYTNSFNSWLTESSYDIDDSEKKLYLSQMFEESKLSVIYGAAGTGKSTTLKHLANFFSNKSKLFLCHTNPAIDNLKRKIDVVNSDFMTIHKYLKSKYIDSDTDLLIIDECSTVSNTDMISILEKTSYKLLIVVGDVFQIEAINFGNWFYQIKNFLPQHTIFELNSPYRTKRKELLKLWDKVRSFDIDILEHLTRNNFSSKLNDSIFSSSSDDEIILCLNYDGLYGINNINRFLQNNNPNREVEWETHTYKIGDPIIFNDSRRFQPLLYNNLKGRIIDIKMFPDEIYFEIEIDKSINNLDTENYEMELIDEINVGKSIIGFKVNKHKTSDEDDEDNEQSSNIPFQVAYAVSIHKAQGLEYNSVKLVISESIEESITHNIFYTAITRASEHLKIYWSAETENKILSQIKNNRTPKDGNILKFYRRDVLQIT